MTTSDVSDYMQDAGCGMQELWDAHRPITGSHGAPRNGASGNTGHQQRWSRDRQCKRILRQSKGYGEETALRRTAYESQMWRMLNGMSRLNAR